MNTLEEVLDELSYDDNVNVLINVAVNKNTPLKTLDRLSDCRYEEVRMCIARNRRTPPHVLNNLIHDSNNNVLTFLVWNTNLALEDLNYIKYNTPHRDIAAEAHLVYSRRIKEDYISEDLRRIIVRSPTHLSPILPANAMMLSPMKTV